MEPVCPSQPSPWTDLFLSPSRGCYQQLHLQLVDTSPEPCGACLDAADSWLCWESSAGKSCRPQPCPLSAPPCGSAGVRPNRRSYRTRGSSDASSGSASAESEDLEMSEDTKYNGGGFRSVSFYG